MKNIKEFFRDFEVNRKNLLYILEDSNYDLKYVYENGNDEVKVFLKVNYICFIDLILIRSLLNEYKEIILKNFSKDKLFDILIKKEPFYILIDLVEKGEKFSIEQLNILLEKFCEEKNINKLDTKNIKLLLNYGANEEIVYRKIKDSIIDNSNFDVFKFFVSNFENEGIILEELRKKEDINFNEKLNKQLSTWLEEKCNEEYKNGYDIKFLLGCGADEEIVYKKIKDSIIDNSNFDVFKFFVSNFEDEGIILEELRKKEDKIFNEVLNKQLSTWLEEKCNEEYKNGYDIKFLLDCGADEKIIYERISRDFYTFKSFVENCRFYQKEIINKIKEKLQNKLDSFLEEKCDNEDIENIKFLIKQGADKELVYKKIKDSIKNSNFKDFKFFVENFKAEGISLEELREKEEDINFNEDLNKRLATWLEEKCNDQKEEDIKFLLREDIGANKEEALKIAVKKWQEHFKSFKYLIEKLEAKLEKIREDENINNKLQEQIDSWLEEKCKEKEKENIKFLLRKDVGANKEILYEEIKKSVDKNNPNFNDFKFFVENFKKEGIILEELRKKEDINFNEKLNKQLSVWLEEKCNDQKEKDIKFLLREDIEAKEEIIKNKIKDIIREVTIGYKTLEHYKFYKENFYEYIIEIKNENKGNTKLLNDIKRFDETCISNSNSSTSTSSSSSSSSSSNSNDLMYPYNEH